MRVTLGTTNPGKLKELEAILRELGVQWTLCPRPAMGEIVEDGQTFEENALIKAKAVQAVAGGYALADDSGLEVDALGGAPGVVSARFAGPNATDDDNNRHLLQKLKGMDAGQRRARFVAAIALVGPEGVLGSARGVCEGHIAEEARGAGGFGYDPYFIPDGYGQSMAQLSAAEKNGISHRGRALRALLAELQSRKVI